MVLGSSLTCLNEAVSLGLNHYSEETEWDGNLALSEDEGWQNAWSGQMLSSEKKQTTLLPEPINT